jgi:hypothetical protein
MNHPLNLVFYGAYTNREPTALIFESKPRFIRSACCLCVCVSVSVSICAWVPSKDLTVSVDFYGIQINKNVLDNKIYVIIVDHHQTLLNVLYMIMWLEAQLKFRKFERVKIHFCRSEVSCTRIFNITS